MLRVVVAKNRAPVSIVAVVGLLSIGLSSASAFPGAPYFDPGQPYTENFPDPAIIEVDGTYYAYATSTGGSALPVMSSTDLETWIAIGDALGSGPNWSPKVAGRTEQWAPTVVRLSEGDYLAAYAVRTGAGERRCISTAKSTSPTGPFVDSSSGPFLCEPDPNGAIDPFLTVDGDGVPWLIWKNEGVPVGYPGLGSRRTAFWSRELSDDGSTWRPGSTVNFLIETTELERPWQGTVIENPAIIEHDGRWQLFYSANNWNSPSYAIGWASCSSPAGPCIQPSVSPVLASNDSRLGPGAPAPLIDPEGLLMVAYHGWNPPHTDYPNGQRRLYLEHVCIAGDHALAYVPDGRTFCDVPVGSYYTDAVGWLAAEGVTTGVSPSAYGSGGAVTRGQMAAFLWRLMGSPSGSPPAGFTDVEEGKYYSEAVNWLAAEGITTGLTSTLYGPDGVVTRAQMAAFLWRLVGNPGDAPTSDFADVIRPSFYADGVDWLADREITTGTSATTYDPDEVVTRAQMAAFLCRLSGSSDYAAIAAPTPAC